MILNVITKHIRINTHVIMSATSDLTTTTTESVPHFPVYIIRSKWSLVQLDNFLKYYGDVGFLRIVYDINGRETDRTIAILSESAYASLCAKGYNSHRNSQGVPNNFTVSPFILKENDFPGNNTTATLFVPVPKPLCGDETEVLATIIDKLKHLSEWGIVEDESWVLNLPLVSREKGGVKKGCFISFKRGVSIESIAMVRVLLTDTYWPDEDINGERPVFRCFWARDRNDSNDHHKQYSNTRHNQNIDHRHSPHLNQRVDHYHTPTHPSGNQHHQHYQNQRYQNHHARPYNKQVNHKHNAPVNSESPKPEPVKQQKPKTHTVRKYRVKPTNDLPKLINPETTEEVTIQTPEILTEQTQPIEVPEPIQEVVAPEQDVTATEIPVQEVTTEIQAPETQTEPVEKKNKPKKQKKQQKNVAKKTKDEVQPKRVILMPQVVQPVLMKDDTTN
jgi:hypothetical protein